MGTMEDAIFKVLSKEGRMNPDTIDFITGKVIEKMEELGLEYPTFNLLWMIISQESIYSAKTSQDFAKYILELMDTGTYQNDLEKTLERINQMINSKN
jgi:hypothetical protein